eukprot:3636560-Pleurochrysis_carterae.AAC.1
MPASVCNEECSLGVDRFAARARGSLLSHVSDYFDNRKEGPRPNASEALDSGEDGALAAEKRVASRA